MTKIFLPLKNRAITLDGIFNILKNSIYKKLELIISCEKNNKIIEEFKSLKSNKYNTKINVFSNGTSEECMIENTLKDLPETNFILVRDSAPTFTSENIDSLITESLQGSDVVMLQDNKPKSKFKLFLDNIINKLCKLFFNYKYYDGDIGLQYFSAESHLILKSTNSTLMTKLNRWIALNIAYVPTQINNNKHNKVNYPKKPLIMSIIFSVLFVLTFALSIILPIFSGITFIRFMLFLLTFVVEISLGIYYFIKLYNINKVGKLEIEESYRIELLEK